MRGLWVQYVCVDCGLLVACGGGVGGVGRCMPLAFASVGLLGCGRAKLYFS